MEVKVKVVFNFMMNAFSNARNFVVATCLPFKFLSLRLMSVETSVYL